MDALRQAFFDMVKHLHAVVDATAASGPGLTAVIAALVAPLDPILYGELFGRPGWMWLMFVISIVLLLAFDLGVLHRSSREIGVAESLALSAGYTGVALACGFWVWHSLGEDAGMAYLTGFFVEKSLALDNVFVIAMILGYFAIPRRYHHVVLFWGILGVIVLRAVMIAMGAALVTEFQWILYNFRRVPGRHRHQDAPGRRPRGQSRRQPVASVPSAPVAGH